MGTIGMGRCFFVSWVIAAVTAEGRCRVPFKGGLLMLRRCSAFLFGLVLAVVGAFAPAAAARPIVDVHKLDEFFALFAPDSNVPWKSTRVRLDTYSGAPVDFAAYRVDPADVLVAGSNARQRPVNLRRLRPVIAWRFVPRPGFRYQSSEVTVPLGAREGFFVVAARRGPIEEQVWINRTRIALLSKQTAGSMLLYGADLGSGRALKHMRVEFVVGGRFVERFTDARGIVQWFAKPRPVFALADWGSSVAFVSFLPQAPEPREILGVRIESAVVHVGDVVRVVGFARARTPAALRPSTGIVNIALRFRGSLVAQASARLDAAGAFTGALRVPSAARAGDYAVLVSHGSAAAGALLHVDADANGIALKISACENLCVAGTDVPVTIRATRGTLAAGGIPLRVSVVRAPHVLRGPMPDATPWGTVSWYDAVLHTDAQGEATFLIPHPTDGLASTYGVHVASGGATADTRVIVPTARVALQIDLDADAVGAGAPLGFRVEGYDVATGQPAAHLTVRAQLVHGANVAEQTLVLDARGIASGSFSSPQIGSDLVIAKAELDGETAMDARGVAVEPQAPAQASSLRAADIVIAMKPQRYAIGAPVIVRATETAARGDALLTVESALGVTASVSVRANGRASATFRAVSAPGQTVVGAAFVRDGSLRWSTLPLFSNAVEALDTPRLVLDRSSYVPGQTALVRIGEPEARESTLLVRIARGTPSGSAFFDSIAQPLAIGGADSQDSAPSEASWHPWVDASGLHAQVVNFARRGVQPHEVTLSDADTKSVYWKAEREAAGSVRVPVPDTRGNYTISVVEIDDDGRVAAASSNLVVK